MRLKAGDVIVNCCYYLLILDVAEDTEFYSNGTVEGIFSYRSISLFEAQELWKQGATVLDTDKTFPGCWPPFRPVKVYKIGNTTIFRRDGCAANVIRKRKKRIQKYWRVKT